MTLRLALAALTMIVLSVFAFWPQYLSRIRTAESYTHVHAVLGSCWLLLLVVQPLLVRSAKLELHRFIGRVGCFWVRASSYPDCWLPTGACSEWIRSNSRAKGSSYTFRWP
jgi:hypothetical protein